MLLLLLATPAASQIAYSHHSGMLYRLALVTDGSDVRSFAVTSTGLDGASAAMALGPDGLLYAAHSRSEEPYALYSIDPLQGDSNLVGELVLSSALSRPRDMTFTLDGTLLLLEVRKTPQLDTVIGTISSVNLTTAELTPLADFEDLSGLDSYSSVLYGLEFDPFRGAYLVSIELGTATMSRVAALEGITTFPAVGPVRLPDRMAFDDNGGLWVSGAEIFGVAIPEEEPLVSYYPNPSDGRLAAISKMAGPYFVLEVAGSANPIPAASARGALLLFAVLAILGIARIGRP